jgi:ribosome-associated protein
MKQQSPSPLCGEKLVNAILKSLEDALAEEITVIDLRKQIGASDWFIVCQGDNNVHTRACADRIYDDLAAMGTKPWQREGIEEGRWILLDYSDVVVHIMLQEVREFYQLEKLWSTGDKK